MLLAIVNSIVQRKGYSPLPISDIEVEQIISDVILYGTAIVNWWKDNPITEESIIANRYFKKLKDAKKGKGGV